MCAAIQHIEIEGELHINEIIGTGGKWSKNAMFNSLEGSLIRNGYTR
jgi:hypothetical protein